MQVIPVSPRNVRSLGAGPAILYGYLMCESGYMRNRLDMEISCGRRHPGDEDEVRQKQEILEQLNLEWFPFSVKDIEHALGLSADRQARYLKRLEQKGLIKIKRRGLPSRRWILLDPKKEP